MCFVGIYKGKEMMVNKELDYYHCKGCLRCVTICPSNALVSAKEEDYPEKPYFMANQDLLRTPDYFEESGVDGYITSESFLTEKRGRNILFLILTIRQVSDPI